MNPLLRLFYNRAEHRPRALWRILLHAGLVLLLLLAVAAALAAAGVAPTPEAPGGAGSLLLWISLQAGVVLLACWIAVRAFDRRRFADLGLAVDGRWWIDFSFGLALGVLLMALVFALEVGVGWAGPVRLSADRDTLAVVASYLLIYLVVGVYEEILSRGYHLVNAFEGLARLGTPVALAFAVLLSSSVFGVLHAGNPGATWISTTNIALAGVLLAAGAVFTGTLAIPIGLHVTWNFAQGPLFGFPVSGVTPSGSLFSAEQGGPAVWTGGEFGPEAGMIGVAAMLLGIALTVAYARVTRGVLGLHEWRRRQQRWAEVAP